MALARSSRSCRRWAVGSTSEIVGVALLALACGSEAAPEEGAPARDPSEVALAIGQGDGSPSSVTLTPVYVPKVEREATALAFNPAAADELWITLRERETDEPCTQEISTGCDALVGKMIIVSNASTSPDSRIEVDANSWHFLRNPTSISFSPAGTFGTCGEARTANYTDDSVPYNGPVLWDPALFGDAPGPGQNGLHLDMLHQTPFCMGIAHERGNVYWTFNGDVGALDRYDFNAPHHPGGEDHADGELLRYVEGALSRVERVPSHVDYDERSGWVYVADTGNGRVVRLDSSTGTPGADVIAYDPIGVHRHMDGAVLEEVVPPGVLERPSGLVLHEGVLFVTDNATSVVSAFTAEGELLRQLDTGLPFGSLSGIAIGPSGHAFLSNLITAEVVRVDVP